MKLQMGGARSPLPLPRGNDATSFPVDGSPSEEMLILHRSDEELQKKSNSSNGTPTICSSYFSHSAELIT